MRFLHKYIPNVVKSRIELIFLKNEIGFLETNLTMQVQEEGSHLRI
jgi:hypothetical protein